MKYSTRNVKTTKPVKVEWYRDCIEVVISDGETEQCFEFHPNTDLSSFLSEKDGNYRFNLKEFDIVRVDLKYGPPDYIYMVEFKYSTQTGEEFVKQIPIQFFN